MNNIFSFTEDNLVKAQNIIKKYPEGKQRSAVLPLLHLAQEQMKGYLSTSSLEYVAKFLDMPFIRVYEIATFYTMFNFHPIGKYHIQVCTVTPCWLRGSDKIMKICENKLEMKCGINNLTHDGKFSLVEIECLAACVNAPVVQINNDYFGNLTEEKMSDLIDKMKRE